MENRLQLQKIRNTWCLKLHIAVLQALGVCPFKSVNFKSQIYAVSILGSLSSMVILLEFYRLNVYRTNFNMFERFLTASAVYALFFFFINLLRSNLQYPLKWKNLHRALSKFDRNFAVPSSGRLANKWTLVRFTSIHLLPLLFSSIDYIMYRFIGYGVFEVDITFYFPEHVGIFYLFQITMFFHEMARVLQSRYCCLEENLINIFSGKIVNNSNSEFILASKIRNFKYQYMLLYDAVEQINYIFGFTLMFALFNIMAMFLSDLYWIMYLTSKKSEIIIEVCYFTVMIGVSNKNYYGIW